MSGEADSHLRSTGLASGVPEIDPVQIRISLLSSPENQASYGFGDAHLIGVYCVGVVVGRKNSTRSAFSLKPDRKLATSGGTIKNRRISGDAGIIQAEIRHLSG